MVFQAVFKMLKQKLLRKNNSHDMYVPACLNSASANFLEPNLPSF
jgi:hypothetical protein